MTHIETFLAGVGVGSILFPIGFWFWACLVIDFLCLSWLVSDGYHIGYDFYDEPSIGKATFLILVTTLVLQFFTHIKVFTWLAAHPLLALAGFTAYIAMGIGWSFIKWTTLLVDWRDRNKTTLVETTTRIEDYQAQLSKDVSQATEHDSIIKERIAREKKNLLSTIPIAKNNKSRIIAWTAYWPWNLLWTFVTDYVRRFFQRIFQMLEAYYDSVQKRILKDFYKD